MYKLIIGTVRITVADDNISRSDAITAAKKAIAAANQQGKLLSHVEIDLGDSGLEIKTTEKTGTRVTRKTLKQSMLDGMHAAIREKLYPTGTFAQKDVWYDGDTGQEWHGSEVETARSELLAKFAQWSKTI
ncbi:hypothetical protein TcarDRAFT_1238 [Thermosinus carboxydivorans Nor1]|uniref:Uncharacterized protein n=1 Tax=Thermosinus carboxydivorans Nor1 TaxID=401526 RepID=A1HQZ5_9FIRM|nr:hypothetical protein [Thermosinus carboxydivorans]EAX47503.1 hypothetical protein TcarDRAFT_1238 [Thermosinus carboxydivorans Nor1]